MIAVSFALKSESSDFVRLLKRGSLRSREITMLHTGVGAKAAHSRVLAFLETNTPHLLISSGFAGALHGSWQPGELLLAQNFSSAEVFDAARRALPNARSGRLHTMDAIVDSSAGRADLAGIHNADAVDMETAIIAEACAERSIPVLSLRVISDTPLCPFPAPPDILFDVERQRTNYARLCLYIATHPAALPRLTRFARQIASARAALAHGLEALAHSEPFQRYACV